MQNNNQPSKYHQKIFNGKTNMWMWNTSHPELVPTRIIRIDGTEYCYYCGKKAMPIQGNLNKRNYHNRFSDDDSYFYQTTGHTCYCEGCEKESEPI